MAGEVFENSFETSSVALKRTIWVAANSTGLDSVNPHSEGFHLGTIQLTFCMKVKLKIFNKLFLMLTDIV